MNMNDDQRAAIAARLQEIADANGGRLTPDDVVADAKNKSSPLHEYFEWDKGKAAAAYWIEQARRLIVSVRIRITTTEPVVRTVVVPCYVRDPSAASSEQGYASVTRLRTEADRAREALVAEFSRAAHHLRRARDLAAVLGADGDVEELLAGIVGMRNRFMDPPSQRQ